jgi:hypothetical protein
MYNAAMRRAQTLGGAFDTAVNTMYERQEENKAFNSKLKALESMIQTHSTKFGMDPDQLKQFLSVNPNESPKERYLRIGGFFEGTIKAAELQKMQLANQKAQTEIDQLKKLGAIYESFGAPTGPTPAVAGQPPAGVPSPAPAVQGQPPAGAPSGSSRYRRVDGGTQAATPAAIPAPAAAQAPAPAPSEMGLINSLRRFSPPQDTGSGMVGAQPFRLPTQMAAPAAAPAAASAVPTPATGTSVASDPLDDPVQEHFLFPYMRGDYATNNFKGALDKLEQIAGVFPDSQLLARYKTAIQNAAAEAGVKLGEVAPTETKTEPKAVKASEPAPEGIPRPKIPSWYETLKTPMEIAAETAGAPGEMDLSPEAQAIARQLREQYEASLPVEEGKSPKKSISAADGRKGAQKGITLDGETLRAIIQDPRILMQLRAGRRVDGLIEDRQQLRALQEMMLPRRSR